MLFRLEQIVGRLREIAAFPGDDAEVPENLAPPGGGGVRGNRQQLVALCQRFVVATPGDVELHFVHGEIELARVIAVLLESASSLVVGGLGVRQLTQLHVGQCDVVQHLCFVIAHTQRLVSEMTQAKGLEGAANVPANHRDGAKVLIYHGDQGSIPGELGLVARGGVDRGGLVQVARDLIDNPNDVEGLGDRRRRADDIRGGNGSFEEIERGPTVPLLEISVPEPSERGETSRGKRIRIPYDPLVNRARVAPASIALSLFRAIDSVSDGGRFHRPQFDCGPAVRHGGATTVPERALSRGFPNRESPASARGTRKSLPSHPASSATRRAGPTAISLAESPAGLRPRLSPGSRRSPGRNRPLPRMVKAGPPRPRRRARSRPAHGASRRATGDPPNPPPRRWRCVAWLCSCPAHRAGVR